MTDATDVRETLRERAKDARVRIMDYHSTISYEEATVVALLNVAKDYIDTVTRERDALRDEVARLTELAALSGEVFAFAITDSKLPNLETRRQLHDAVNRALTAALTTNAGES
jgi:hypothetical protein